MDKADQRSVEELVGILGQEVNEYTGTEQRVTMENAAEALTRSGSDEARDGLIGILCLDDTKEEHDYARTLAIRALGKIGDHRAISPLCEALRSEWHGTRTEAARALGNIGGKRVEIDLSMALEREDEYCAKTELVRCMGRIKSLYGLRKALEHEDANVRYDAVIGLEKLGSAEAAEAIRSVLNDDYRYVREAASSAIEKTSLR